MKLAIALILTSLAFGETTDRPRDIIGGRDTDSREFPTVLYVAGCTGTLIAERWALTAAHCIAGKPEIGLPVERGWPEDWEARTSIRTVVHPEYVWNENWTKNDLALVQFNWPFESPTVKYQKLATPEMLETLLLPGTLTTSVGWGEVAEDQGTKTLQVVDLAVSECPSQEEFGAEGYVLRSTDFCRRMVPYKSQVYWGDSGGPVLVAHQGEMWQVGWASYNTNAMVDGAWQYHGISHKTGPYLEWISQHAVREKVSEIEIDPTIPSGRNLDEDLVLARDMAAEVDNLVISHQTMLSQIRSDMMQDPAASHEDSPEVNEFMRKYSSALSDLFEESREMRTLAVDLVYRLNNLRKKY